MKNRRIIDFAVLRNSEHFLSFVVVADRVDLLRAAARRPKVIQRFLIDWEKAHRGTILGGHVRDGRAICRIQGSGSLAEVFDKFADYIRFPKHFSKTK